MIYAPYSYSYMCFDVATCIVTCIVNHVEEFVVTNVAMNYIKILRRVVFKN